MLLVLVLGVRVVLVVVLLGEVWLVGWGGGVGGVGLIGVVGRGEGEGGVVAGEFVWGGGQGGVWVCAL